jgi:arsenate reductase-like glutaredoxin family protein
VTITIYHNPDCGTSRNTLAMIRQSLQLAGDGEQPVVIDYLKTPPDRATILKLVADAGLTLRDALRLKDTLPRGWPNAPSSDHADRVPTDLLAALGLDDASLTSDWPREPSRARADRAQRNSGWPREPSRARSDRAQKSSGWPREPSRARSDRAQESDTQLLDAIERHPILLNRPFVVTPRGTRLCRPSETVLQILPNPHIGRFVKEDGEVVQAD